MHSSAVTYETLELEEHQSLSPSELVYNKARGTKKFCIGALCFSALVGSGFIVVGGVAKGFAQTFHLTSFELELIPFCINILVLIATEANGYIHTVSLRWALFYEGKLEFNSNLRLLTFSKRNPANGVIANIIYFISLAVSYAASPLVVVRNTDSYYHYEQPRPLWKDVRSLASLSRAAPLALGCAILVQCALSTWCIKSSIIPTWSSNPLTTLAAANNTGRIVYQRGRCMMSAHERSQPTMATAPRARQKSPYHVNKGIMWVLLAISVVLGAFIVWTGLIVYYGNDNSPNGTWDFFPTAASDDFYSLKGQTQTVFLKFFSNGGTQPVSEPKMLGCLAFNVIIQSFLTIGMHCAELQVTLRRDEHVWSSLELPSGSKPQSTYNSITQPVHSLPNLILLLFKPIVHWMFGAALSVDYARGVLMRVPHITYLTVLWTLFVIFAFSISFTSRKGQLPSSYGHLQTMLDVAGESAHSAMYWGDKGEVQRLTFENELSYTSGVRHSGVSTKDRLEPVQMGVPYS